MTAVSIDAFRREYRRSVDELLPFFTPERVEVLGKHNPGWGPTMNIEGYLRASETRYVKALELAEIARPGSSGGPLLEIGGFMGAFPLAMQRIGVAVTLSEKYGYYYGAFDEIRDRLEEEGVGIWDRDLTQPLDPVPEERFELVTAMAIIEHLADGPKRLIENSRALLAPQGRLIMEVPNIAFWPKRLGLLQGQSPHPPLRHVWDSEPPFTGHHREYTGPELEQVLTWGGLLVDHATSYNYTPQVVPRVWRPLIVWPSRREACREVLMASARLP